MYIVTDLVKFLFKLATGFLRSKPEIGKFILHFLIAMFLVWGAVAVTLQFWNPTGLDAGTINGVIAFVGFGLGFYLLIFGTAFMASQLPENKVDEILALERAFQFGHFSVGESIRPASRNERGRSEYDVDAVAPKLPSPTRAPDFMDVIDDHLTHLLEYYVINKAQAKNSFRASTTAVFIGFLTIVAGIWLSYYGMLTNNTALYISVLAGVILQFVGGAYFYLYNRSLIQLNFFFSRLALMQDTVLSIHLTNQIPEGPERNRVLEKLIFLIVTRDAKSPDYLGVKDKAPPNPRATKPNADGATK